MARPISKAKIIKRLARDIERLVHAGISRADRTKLVQKADREAVTNVRASLQKKLRMLR